MLIAPKLLCVTLLTSSLVLAQVGASFAQDNLFLDASDASGQQQNVSQSGLEGNADPLGTISDARNADPSIITARNCEVEDCSEPEENLPPPPPEERYIRLGGILFNSSSDWTIWLNKVRVTPKALPEEILDLRVFKQYVEMKWYDKYTKQILPVRIRPHQSFHMDQRIFLPG